MRILVASALVVASLAAFQPTVAEDATPRVFRLPTPPADFKPLTASDADLVKYGLPARPNPFARSAVPYAAWSRAMSAARTRIEPMVRETGRHHGAAMGVRRRADRLAGALTSTNWSGQAVYNYVGGFGSGSYTEALGQWVVSNVQQPIGTCHGTDVSAIWVGIDGTNGSSDVFQAGTEADATCSFGNTSGNYYAWFEWYPGDEYELTNFAVYPGAPIFVLIHATSPTTGTATFVNLQSNQYTTMGLTAPSGTTLIGDSAEWIVERPSLGDNNNESKLGNLADYGLIWMSSEVAFLASEVGTNSYDVAGAPGYGRTANTFTMYDNSGNQLSVPYPQGISAQYFDPVGAAY